MLDEVVDRSYSHYLIAMNCPVHYCDETSGMSGGEAKLVRHIGMIMRKQMTRQQGMDMYSNSASHHITSHHFSSGLAGSSEIGSIGEGVFRVLLCELWLLSTGFGSGICTCIAWCNG